MKNTRKPIFWAYAFLIPKERRLMDLSKELNDIRFEIEVYAREYGLDFFETVFEVLNDNDLNIVASRMGFPKRWPHWKFGMEYERLSKSYANGLHKIYEMVINNDPCYAYLLESNNVTDQKIVMAHVYGHCDFFKNNIWFSKTNRKMMDKMANNAEIIKNHINRQGYNNVESFIDLCLSIDNLIDPYSPFVENHVKKRESLLSPQEKEEKHPQKIKVEHRYMENYINPKDFLLEQQKRIEEEEKREKQIPEKPERDVLLFLIEHAPLEKWQREILEVIREEAYYFLPQGRTKIMNEGWASYWHSKIMTQRALKDPEVIDYADHHSGTVAKRKTTINPYALGLALFKDIEDRWNKGKFGKDYDDCKYFEEKSKWNTNLGLGREKIFEVRKTHNDITFIQEFFTEEFCREQKMFTIDLNPESNNYELSSRQYKDIKKKLLWSITNFGQPVIRIINSDFEHRGELYLKQDYEEPEIGLDIENANATLANLYKIWTRPVHIETIDSKERKLLSFDGSYRQKNLIF